MEIKKTMNGTELTVVLEGRLDTTTAPELENEVSASIADANKVYFDFEKLDYISSAGLRVVLGIHKQMMAKEGLVLQHVNETVMEVFEVTGFSDILTIE